MQGKEGEVQEKERWGWRKGEKAVKERGGKRWRMGGRVRKGEKVIGRERDAPTILESVLWFPSTRPGTRSLRMKEERKRMKAFGGRGM